MPAIEVKLQGVVHKTTIKAPKLDELGNAIDQDIEVTLVIPLDDMTRTKLADISRLQNGKTTNIVLEETAPLLFEDEETRKAKVRVETN